MITPYHIYMYICMYLAAYFFRPPENMQSFFGLHSFGNIKVALFGFLNKHLFETHFSPV